MKKILIFLIFAVLVLSVFALSACGEPASGNVFTLTFDGNGGAPSSVLKEFLEGESISGVTPPARAGFEFLGWTAKADDAATKITADYKVSESVTLYALWAEKEPEPAEPTYYSLSAYCVLDGVPQPEPKSCSGKTNGVLGLISDNMADEKLKTPVGFVFDGVFFDVELENAVAEDYEMTGDLTVYLKFSSIEEDESELGKAFAKSMSEPTYLIAVTLSDKRNAMFYYQENVLKTIYFTDGTDAGDKHWFVTDDGENGTIHVISEFSGHNVEKTSVTEMFADGRAEGLSPYRKTLPELLSPLYAKVKDAVADGDTAFIVEGGRVEFDGVNITALSAGDASYVFLYGATVADLIPPLP